MEFLLNGESPFYINRLHERLLIPNIFYRSECHDELRWPVYVSGLLLSAALTLIQGSVPSARSMYLEASVIYGHGRKSLY